MVSDAHQDEDYDAAWAFLWGRRILTAAFVESAIRMQRNNISPGPCGRRVRIVTIPKETR